MADTIFALSSGAPPAAIGVVRLSGPASGQALSRLVTTMPAPRQAVLRTLRGGDRAILDVAMVLWLPGPATATAEDMVELHCHGGRAVIAAVEAALAEMPELRQAEPGEFTRRAFVNGRIDLAEAEGLADLLSAETELQRRNALSLAGGVLSRQVETWRGELLDISALIEAALDFTEEDDAFDASEATGRITALASNLGIWLSRPTAELLRDGLRVVIAGPPNAGKSSLFNAIVGTDAAIVSSIAGTTRDVVSRPVALAGVPFVFADTAGLRDDGDDEIERIGMARASREAQDADIVLWLGSEGQGVGGSWEIEAKIDDLVQPRKQSPRHRLSTLTGVGISALMQDLTATARSMTPNPGDVAINRRQRRHIEGAYNALIAGSGQSDPLIVGECLRRARLAFDQLIGRATTEDMLDELFARFCIGK